jgi:hypothetical protein
MDKDTLAKAIHSNNKLRYLPKGTIYDIVSLTLIKHQNIWEDGICYQLEGGTVFTRLLSDLVKFELVER